MNISRFISYLLIAVGAGVAIYSNTSVRQNDYMLIGGIVILMMGIYRVSKNIPSKFENETEEEKDLKK